MKRFWAFVKKEILHIFRDKRSMLILFGIPIAQILIFGFAITNEIKDADIAILDLSKDEQTREIREKIISSGYFILKKDLQSAEEIEQSFQKGEVRIVVIFEPGFGRKLQRDGAASIQILADASDPNLANMLVAYTNSIINDYQSGLASARPSDMPVIKTEVKMEFNAELKGVFMFVPGTITIILMLVSAMMTSISITREKEMGTMEVLLVSPLKPLQIILGKVTPYLIFSFINALSILILGNMVFGMPNQGSIMLLLAETLLFILMALSLGILISTATKSQQTAMMLSMVALMLPTILLSGFIFPIENMPELLQWFSLIMPPRWFISLIKTIMLKGGGIMYVWKETLIIAGMCVLFIVLSIRKFKTRLE